MEKNRLSWTETNKQIGTYLEYEIKSSMIPVGGFGNTHRQLKKLDALTINNNILPISTKIKILGYKLSPNTHSSHDVIVLTGKARSQLNKWNIFGNWPPKIKNILY